ncbi:MAG TPA: hypothetical protein PK677_08335 [Acidiphilium sp.]|nr:MAG: hypothetical protein B7Z67_02740 [Acidiphilium sp. 21-60-14]OYV89653.1 MAG: hypothetical protein B7Z57_11530 [Acidiphilium sp. 37-60-79]OZB40848.1 MAG: hypothetical protein B7X48_03200 [Acidiphilium sp. 34-60-192]HQT88550.1 hypothetical protein [Acidiphilium sp.]HQU24381.1 hypothetical protein [Acidiphilium sp.]
MSKTKTPPICSMGRDDGVETAIDFVLTHPDMSDWSKRTVRDALVHDPVLLLNELAIITQVLQSHAMAAIRAGLAGDQGCG